MTSRSAASCISDGSWLSVDQASTCAKCKAERLVSCAMLPDAADNDVRALANRATLEPGHVLFSDNDPADSVHVVVSGMMRCSKYLSTGRRYVAAFMGPGDLLGISSTDHHPYAAECVTEVEVCSFSKPVFMKHLEDNADLKQRILNSVSNELVEAQVHAMLLANESAKARASAFLLLMRNRQMRRAALGQVIHLPMSRVDIADYLGVAHETLSRALKGLEADGLIALEKPTEIRISDADGLAQLTGETLDSLDGAFTASQPSWGLI